MINYDVILNLSSGVTYNWCIQLDAPQSLALRYYVSLDMVSPQHVPVSVVGVGKATR